jgi:surfeit locus 1 family protein
MRRAIPWLMFVLMEITLVSLGVWQLQRKDWKEALLAQMARNAEQPAFALSRPDQVTTDMEYARVNFVCAYKLSDQYSVEGFDAAAKIAKRRYIKCSRPAAIVVDLGWHAAAPDVVGGAALVTVSGRIRHWTAPSAAQALGGIKLVSPKDFTAPVAPFYVQAGDALPPPLPNNHLAYAMQWGLFAGVLAIIFVLFQRRQRLAPPPSGA